MADAVEGDTAARRRFLPGLTRDNLPREVMAGVTLIAIAVPLNIGYAQIAGLPVTAGLYALILPTIVYALTVSSRQVVASPDAAAAALVASSLGGLAVAGSEDYSTLALAQAIIVGVMFLALSYFKLGFLANFLSKPILVGFVGGLALDIMVSQVSKMFGISQEAGSKFIDKVSTLVGDMGEFHVWSLVLSAIAVAILLLGRRWRPMVPWALVVLIVATVIVVAVGAEESGIDVLGEVPSGPPEFTLPVLDWSMWLALIPSALALTMITTAEGLLISRAYSEKNGYPVKPNRDLFAYGASNIVAGLSASLTVGSSTSRTAAMDQAGSRTQLPSIVLAAGTLLLVVFGTSLLADIPSPAIGAIVAVAIIPLLGFRDFQDLWHRDRTEFFIGVVCFLVTLLVGSIPGILVAFVLALTNLARRASNPAIDVLEHSGDPGESLLEDAPRGDTTAPGVIVVRLAAPLFFANADVFSQAVKKSIHAAGVENVDYLVVDMEAVTDIDVTGAESFEALQRWLVEQDIVMSFSRVRDDAIDRLDRMGLIDDYAIYPTNREAIADLELAEEEQREE
ncbi:SulP family inorganic anion transporter [Demequina sediminicola]|uniref:SulP family inorganic anion transporter n=1 Tax=Demequina sediminicola TaxID=1095026 RepID=UPI000780E8B8|nr:SulP family inorganic anion transporter [Demequina sediminicola]